MDLMTGGLEASLMQILDAREQRVARQRELHRQFGSTLICFTMNIAGPVKYDPLIRWGFEYGSKMLRAQLDGEGIQILHRQEFFEVTGCEGYWVVSAEADRVKRLTVQIEDHAPVGRLFDMDVLTSEGEKIQRNSLGLPVRKCLICHEDAVVCGRSRVHSVEQLREKTRCLLQDAMKKEVSAEIAYQACRSLLYEVCVTPKPGLVDRNNSGSHRDMDIFTFMTSASALFPYFQECAGIGMETRSEDAKETFRRLRLSGRMAEQKMREVTAGVNTHKGAIFTMGLLCGAAGRTAPDCNTDEILDLCAEMTRGLTKADLIAVDGIEASTAGRKLFAQYGIGGIRAEAEAGFPAVRTAGLPALERGVRQGLSLNDAGSGALLAIMAAADDTNLISRGSRQRQLQIAEQLRNLLDREPFPDRRTLMRMDDEFIAENLSPGGSADLLAASFFLYFLKFGI